MPVEPKRIRDIFLAAVELPPQQRPAYLAEACGGDDELRAEVEGLLAANADPDSILEPDEPATADATGAFIPGHPATEPDATGAFLHGKSTTIDHADPNATTTAASVLPMPRNARVAMGEGIGTVIAGRYTLVEVIGEGGMGSVYLASQTEPVKRQVALKLIKTGMDSRGVLARFDAERQALALMDHPNIARIYDGGVTPAGQPFFVMELVKGVPLTDYCDAKRLPVQARLELFVSVCLAVQHAHQKGIIHRDLKPGNVLVTEVDGRPTPKVIDFGVAKATEVNLTDMSFSDTGAIVGTPSYMSPEQADPSSMDIDTRTDVYALGVMLYELLVGSPPLDARDFRRGAVLEMLRMVREVDPPRPSTKLSTAEALPNIAANRSIEPGRLSKLLQGELDWVVMKALEKDRNRRYETANGFARDIQRYLADEVVEARPPSRGYRLKKFVKRNKLQVIAASLVFFALLGGIIGTTLGMESARRARDAEAIQHAKADEQRDKAIEAQRQTAIERDKAVEAQARTNTINDFLIHDLLTQAEPANNAVEDKVTLLEVLDRAAQKVGTRFANQPDLERVIRGTIGGTYHGLASWEKAEIQARAMVEAARKWRPKSPEFYDAQGKLSHILRHRGRRNSEVLEMAEAAAKGLEETVGPGNPYTLSALDNLAQTYYDSGRMKDAIDVYERVRDVKMATLGPLNPDTLLTLNNLGLAYKSVGRLSEAVALFESGRDRATAKFGPDHPSTLTAINNLALTYQALGKPAEAIVLFESIRDLQNARFGPKNPYTLNMLSNLASAYKAAGREAEATTLWEHVRDDLTLVLGPDHPDTLNTLNKLGAVYKSVGRLSDAIALQERIRDVAIAKLGPDNPLTLNILLSLAVSYHAAGRFSEAIPLYERSRDTQIAKLGPDHPEVLEVENELAVSYWRTRQLEKSVPIFEDLLKRQEAKLGRHHKDTLMTIGNLGVNYKDSGRLNEAIPLLEEGFQQSKTFPRLHGLINPLMDAYMKAGENGKIAGLLQEQLVDARAMLPKDSPQLAGLLAQTGLALLQQKKWAKAELFLRESLSIREKAQPDVWNTFSGKAMLGSSLLGQKKYAEAEPLLIAGYEGMKQREATIPPQGKVRISEALERLVEFYEATDKKDEAAKWRKELDAIKPVEKKPEKKS